MRPANATATASEWIAGIFPLGLAERRGRDIELACSHGFHAAGDLRVELASLLDRLHRLIAEVTCDLTVQLAGALQRLRGVNVPFVAKNATA